MFKIWFGVQLKWQITEWTKLLFKFFWVKIHSKLTLKTSSFVSTQKSDNLQYDTLVCWDKWLVNQVSDVPSIIFFLWFLAKFFAKMVSMYFHFFYIFTKIKTKNFECPKSIRNYEKKKILEHQMLGRRVICPSYPANQGIIL